MKKFRKVILMVCLLFIALFVLSQTSDKEASAKAKKYMVLIQNVDGETWVVHEGLVKVKESNLMVDAKKVSNLLDLTFSNINNNKFTINRGTIGKTTYTIGKKKYVYDYGGELLNRNAPYAPYISNKSTYIHYSSLGYSVKFKYYDAKKANEFAKQGYDGVICYSRYFSINEVPDLSKVLDTKGKPYFKIAPTPTPEPTTTTIPLDIVNSNKSNYLVLIGEKNDWSGEFEYWAFEGVVEINSEDKVMVNVTLLTPFLNDSSMPYPKYYFNIDDNRFSISNNNIKIFTRNDKVIQSASGSIDNINENAERIAESVTYTSKHNGWDYIDPKQIGGTFPNTTYHFFDATQAKAYAEKGYDGVLLFVHGKEKKIPSVKKIVRTVDFTKLSKIELDKLPSADIMGIKIYGTKKFNKPSEIKTDYDAWGYAFDLEQLKGVIEKNAPVGVGFIMMENVIRLEDMGSGTLAIELEKDTKKDEYFLNLKSMYKVSLSERLGEYTEYDLEAYNLAWRNRKVLLALCYKISSTPELLYKEIINDWAGPGDKIQSNKFIVIGDAKVKFDEDRFGYIIKSAK